MGMYKRVLVTGTGGVLGSAFKGLADEYPQHQFILNSKDDCDLRDPQATSRYVQEIAPDAIIHLAAISGGVGMSTSRPASILRDNVQLTFSMLEAARTHKIPKLLMTLSSGMYPPQSPLPLKEEYIHTGPAHESNYSYAYAKRLIEPAIKSYRTEFGLNVIGLVPNGIFGEWDNFDPESSTMIAALMLRFVEEKNSGKPIVVWGDGSPLREHTYSKDMAKGFLWGLLHYDSPEILNVGTTEEHSVKDIALMIADELGIARERIVFDTSKPAGVPRKSFDNSKFVRLSGFQFTPFRKGLKNTLAWLQDRMGTTRAAASRPTATT